MTGVLHCRVVYASEIIVVSVFCQIQAVANHAVDGIIRISVKIEEPRVLIYAMADTIFSKVVPINRVIMVVAQFYIPEALIAITVLIEEIQIAFNGVPLALNKAGAIIVAFTVVSGQPCTLHQFAVFKLIDYIGEETAVFTIQPLESLGVKVVITVVAICIRQVPPTGLGHAVDGVIPCAIEFNQPSDLSFTSTGCLIELIEILVALIVEARNLVNAFQGIVFDEVVGCTVDRFPARPRTVVQDETIRELLIRFTVEVAAAGVRGILWLLIGINPILFLEGSLLSHAVECVCTQINVVADRTGVFDAQALIRIPLCAVLGGQLHAAEDADGVGRIRIDGLALLDEVALHSEQIILVQGCRCQTEIIIGHRQVGDVHSDILVKLELHRYLGLRTDTLRQLEQQIPGCDAGNIAASNHGQKRFQLFRNLDRHHIQSEDIGDIHGLARIDHMIAVCFAIASGKIFRIGDISCPCEGSVAACGVVKVENRLIGTVHSDLDRGTDGVVPRDHGRDGHIAQTGRLAAGKGKAVIRSFHSTRCAVAQFKCDIACAHSDGILVIGCNQRKAYRVSVNGVDARFGEFQAIRLDHGKRLAADHRVTGQELNFHAALLDGGENTIFRNGTDGFIRGLPCDISREFRRAAGHTDTGSNQADCGAARQVIISRGDQGMIKLRRDRGRGDHHQRGTNGTLITIRRTVHDRERIAAFLLRYEGSGTATVQIDCGHTACVQHDLCQFFSTAAGGEGFLTTVQHHQDNLALSGDTHTGAGMTAVIIVCCAGHDGLSILDQINAAADSLLDLVSIGCVIAGAADHGGSILQNRKEVFRGDTVIFDTLHDQSTAGGTGGHVVKVCIDTDDRIVVFHIVRRVGRIGVALLGRSHLVGYAGHGPALARIVGMIIGVDAHIIAGNISGRNVVNDLLVVLGQRIVDRLRHAGSDRRRIRREHRVVCIIRLRVGFGIRIRVDRVGTVRITRKVKEIICKSVAARFTQRFIVGKIGQRIGALQRTDQGIPGIGTHNLAPDTVLGDHAAQAVGQKVGSAACICKPCGEVVLNDRAQRNTATVHLRCEIESIHIAIEIRIGERVIHTVERAVIHAEVSCANVGGKCIDVSLRGIYLVSDIHVFGAVHQIRNVTGPTAHVGTSLNNSIRHALYLGVIGHIHRTKHMAKVSFIAIGQCEVLDVLQCGGRSAVCGILLGNVGGEGSILLAADHFPGAGGVPLHACTDIVDDQRIGILTSFFLRIGLGIAFQNLEAGKKCLIV